MGHAINGFIAPEDDLMVAARSLPHARICPLDRGFAFLPLTEQIASMDDEASHHQLLIRLSEPMTAWAEEQSSRFPIVYIETDYFGGIGIQNAIVWQDGSVVLGPMRTDHIGILWDVAINTAIRRIGVVRGTSGDEFAALGLDRYRENEDWIAAVGKPVT